MFTKVAKAEFIPISNEEFNNRTRALVIGMRNLAMEIDQSFHSGLISVKQYRGLLDKMDEML